MGGVENSCIAVVEERLGYSFKDVGLLEIALTTPSWRGVVAGQSCEDNQRLEFLGDAVLSLVTAERMCELHQGAGEGELTQRRAMLVSGRSLARVARQLGLGEFLLVSHGADTEGVRGQDGTLADALEAVFGAVYSDGGVEAATDLYRRLFGELEGEVSEAVPGAGNPKGELQMLLHECGRHGELSYDVVEVSGPAHAPLYRVRAALGQELSGEGLGRTRRQAEAEAAQVLLDLLGRR